jgi:succinate dehydrogenase flavin-adding protein (antitoxin of CptAB toxin-antitoxin module)
MERKTFNLPKGQYLQMAKGLSELASKKLVLRFGQKYFDELTATGVQEVEALALLLEMEDQQLNEWRQAMDKIRARNTKARSG